MVHVCEWWGQRQRQKREAALYNLSRVHFGHFVHTQEAVFKVLAGETTLNHAKYYGLLASAPLSYLQRPQYGAGGVHEEESQVTQHVGEGKQALSHQDGVEGVPVLPLRFLHVLELKHKQTHLQQ